MLGLFSYERTPREGVRNEEPLNKYRVISPRNKPARTFLLVLFFLSCCTIFALIVLLRRFQGVLFLSYRVSFISWLLLCFFCAPTVLLTLSKISPSH